MKYYKTAFEPETDDIGKPVYLIEGDMVSLVPEGDPLGTILSIWKNRDEHKFVVKVDESR